MTKFQQSRQDLMWLVMSLMMHHLIISNNSADPCSLIYYFILYTLVFFFFITLGKTWNSHVVIVIDYKKKDIELEVNLKIFM